jgi:uncharacterized protein (TIGR02145 family)
MAENLRYDVPGVYTYYNSFYDNVTDTINPNNPCSSYGRLYDWKTTMNGDTSSFGNPSTARGICPSGWHVLSEAEWKALEKYLGMSQLTADSIGWRGTDEGTKMKSTSGWSFNGNGISNIGFNAFPAGFHYSGNFPSLGDFAYFWSSTEDAANGAWGRILYDGYASVNLVSGYKRRGYSCRCVEN